MTIQVEGQPDPQRVAREQRQARITGMLTKHRGKVVRTMTPAGRDDLLVAVLDAMGWTDAEGRVG